MGCEIKKDFDLSRLTTFRIGGKCESLYIPDTVEDFVRILQELESPLVIAGGSNLLVSSLGVNQPVISTSKLRGLVINEDKITAECGVFGGMLAKVALENCLSGFEFLIAFPGTVGGNLYMNASAHGQFMSDCFVSALVFDNQLKKVIKIEKEEMDFAYKKSILQTGRYILLSAEFMLQKAAKEKIQERMNHNLSSRKQSQPSMSYPNAGCVFKNPENNSAGKLLDDAGFKGLEEEKVKVWDTHANFIVNKGGASSLDVLELMFKMYNGVESKTGIKLEPEVIFIGKKDTREEEICNILYQKIQK